MKVAYARPGKIRTYVPFHSGEEVINPLSVAYNSPLLRKEEPSELGMKHLSLDEVPGINDDCTLGNTSSGAILGDDEPKGGQS